MVNATYTHRRTLAATFGALAVMVLAVMAWAWQVRSNDGDLHRHTNRLIHETSPYLL
ncbi:MAG: hypothetical protein HY320_10170, partial [Armatimonadetes bacterium]|nr:hypothetical protein [Armatimonadota bacterium]